MSKFTQEHRTLELFTPLGKDVLLFQTLTGAEAISELYQFDIDAFAYNDNLPKFADIIGQPVAVEARLASGDSRWFHGIVKSFTCLDRLETHAQYRLEVVPKFWLLSNVSRSRIFQQISIPDILKAVLKSLDVVYELTGTYEQRDYCVQYRETDFAFASRLMEEEGIFYFFRHYEDRHELVVADSSQSHEELPYTSTLHFDTMRNHTDVDERIHTWEKSQHLRTGKVTLWDHSFEKPGSNFEAQMEVRETLPIGAEQHKLRVGGANELEFYEYPGGFAQRFDGINPGGGERPAEIQKITDDNQRTVEIRANQEAIRMISITANTHYMNICPGYKFHFQRHPSDDDTYVITKTNYSIAQPESYRSSGGEPDEVPAPEIIFNCIPFELQFAPPRVTARPLIHGTQVAVVTGPAGEEIFTDKYGRVKVQFFWDREGKHNDTSSCWIRVGTAWAGNNWGMIHIPRIGQEVIVAFEEGDPDQPVILNSVYNAHEMPPHELPANKTWSGVKSRSTPKAGAQNLNEIRFEDKIGNEYIFIHGEKDVHFRCKDSYFGTIGGSFNETVGGDAKTSIGGKKSVYVKGDFATTVDGINHLFSKGDNLLATDAILHLGAGGALRVRGRETVHVYSEGPIKMNTGAQIVVDGGGGVTLSCGGSFVTVSPAGVQISGPMVMINSGGAALKAPDSGTPGTSDPEAPAAALKPEETKPTENPADKAAKDANSHDPNSEENKDKTHWIEVELKDDSGAPVQGETCEITLPNGKKATKSTNKDGLIRIDKIDAGNCKIRWINLDQDAVSQ